MLPLLLLGLVACGPADGDSGASTDGGSTADGGTEDGGFGDGGSDGGGADGGSEELEHVWTSSEAKWTALSTGSQHACALDTKGQVTCWGYDWDGRTDVPDLATPVQAIACGGNFSCALEAGGEIRCWGADIAATTDAPAGTWAAIAAGYDFGCALDDAGAVSCWGDDEHHQLRAVGGPFVQLSAGRTHACGLAADGGATCWGAVNPSSSGFAPAPERLPPPHDGEVVNYGQTILPEGTWSAVSAGDFHTCLLDLDGQPTCIGNDRSGETSPPSGVSFTSISAGGAHTCAITSDQQVRCWGAATASWDYYQALEPPGAFSAIDTASVYTCGLRPAGEAAEILCWGALDDVPVQVP